MTSKASAVNMDPARAAVALDHFVGPAIHVIGNQALVAVLLLAPMCLAFQTPSRRFVALFRELIPAVDTRRFASVTDPIVLLVEWAKVLRASSRLAGTPGTREPLADVALADVPGILATIAFPTRRARPGPGSCQMVWAHRRPQWHHSEWLVLAVCNQGRDGWAIWAYAGSVVRLSALQASNP